MSHENTRHLIDRREAFELLDRMNERMPPVPRPAEVHVIGGGAMMFEYDATRKTEDLDCILGRYREEVLMAAAEVAEEKGLDPDWLNETAKDMGSVPDEPDPDERISYDGSRLTVMSSGPNRLLAMKLHSGRDKDERDIAKLLPLTNTDSIEKAQRLHAEHYGGKEIPPNGMKVLHRHLADLTWDGTHGQEAEPADRPVHPRPHGRGTSRERDAGYSR